MHGAPPEGHVYCDVKLFCSVLICKRACGFVKCSVLYVKSLSGGASEKVLLPVIPPHASQSEIGKGRNLSATITQMRSFNVPAIYNRRIPDEKLGKLSEWRNINRAILFE